MCSRKGGHINGDVPWDSEMLHARPIPQKSACSTLQLFRLTFTLIKMKGDKSNHGGLRPGSGRKANPDTVPTIPVAIRMTEPQRDKLQQLGGASWVREKIDKAKLPNK